MKTLRLLSLLGIILVAGSLTGCGLNTDKNDGTGNFIVEDISEEHDAVINYNDTLVDLASQCIISENNVWNTYSNETTNIEDTQKAINNTITECTKAQKDISQLSDWEGDSSLKDGVLDIIEKEITLYTKFNKLLPYLNNDNLTEDEKTEFDNLFSEIEALDNELLQANQNLISIQENFAKNHGFELESDMAEGVSE